MVEMELANMTVLMLILAGWVAVSLKWWIKTESVLVWLWVEDGDFEGRQGRSIPECGLSEK